MEYIEKIKKILCKELDEYGEKSKFTASDIDMLYKLTDVVKNLDKIAMLEEESGGYSEMRSGRTYGTHIGGSSYDDEMYSECRGRGRNAKRDSMGRYSSDSDSSYDYSEDGSSYRGGSYARDGQSSRGYSRDGAKDHLLNKMGEMMSSADEEQREILKNAMRQIERA